MYELKHVKIYAKSLGFRKEVISLAKYIPFKDKLKILFTGECDTYITLDHQVILMIHTANYNKKGMLNKVPSIKGG